MQRVLQLTLISALLALGGCVTTTVKQVSYAPAANGAAIAEEALLDVGVMLFDPAIPEDWLEREEAGILADVRRAEARFMPQVLKATLQESGNWGAVRVLPRDSLAVDLVVGARIIESNGESLVLAVHARDATGRVWLDEEFAHLTSKYAYGAEAPSGIDPFQPLYNRIADSLLRTRSALTERELARVREVAELRFAEDFAPEAFSGFVARDGARYRLQRLPAENDPMVDRIRRIREREYLFVDTLDEYYSEFRRDMASPYLDYRRFTYDEAVALRRLERQAKRRQIAGAVLAVGGLAAAVASDSPYARTAGAVGMIAGGTTLISGLNKREEAQLHREAIRELGTSLEAEVLPQVIELDDRTITLTGTVDEQYDAWRDILRELYRSELGLPPTQADAPTVATAEPAADA